MSIEELQDTGRSGRATESAWLTTVGAVGAGIAIGVVLMLAIGPQEAPAVSPGPSVASGIARASASPRPSPPPVPANLVATGINPAIPQLLNVDGVSFSFTVPGGGWARYGELYVSKSITGSQGAEAMIFWARYPFGESAQYCPEVGGRPLGPTAADLAASLSTGLRGTELVDGPSDVMVGGLPATRVTLFVRDDHGCGPGLFYTWPGEDQRGGPLWDKNLLGDTITIWVFEIDGQRFIIASETHLNADAELLAEVGQIIDSIDFDPSRRPEILFAADLAPLTVNRLTVDDVTFSFVVPGPAWALYDELYVSKDTLGSQTAEAMVFWTRYPDGDLAGACDWSGDRPTGATAAELATSLSTRVPGTDLVEAPTDVTLGGVPATRVVLSVHELTACGRGYFVGWEGSPGGPFWGTPAQGDTITIWVLDQGGGVFIIASETRANAGAELLAEVEQIVDSIQFQQ